jgi:prepilin-type N-terminal cleavage/methylation domain-containing protein
MTQPRRTDEPWGAQGFTLIELIVALGIMALGVAVALPYLQGTRAGHQLRATAFEIAGQLRDARATAQAATSIRPLSWMSATVACGSMARQRGERCPRAWPSMWKSRLPSNWPPTSCACVFLPMVVPVAVSWCYATEPGEQA